MSAAAPDADEGAVRIEPFRPEWAEAFRRLNLQWLERYFGVEPADLPVLTDPQTRVIDAGGEILFAVDASGEVVGTCALLAGADGAFELSKMSVDEARHGQGIGRRLIEAAIAAFGRRGGRRLFLETNSRLTAALHLYRRSGFVQQAPPQPSHYRRADVYMVWRPAEAER
ncbi:MAG TPA: GNAT family N-acetyltransferase [Dokdonella sp.]|uniref:GNAT family N-acetyltransferase n=1 Tax=Dokdonella sp. TaxID=2291710 RepID=UPI002CBEE6E9|nr:GNAT family N-acetyltransferase [Dokdonella sp.]HUD40701.1 GNAT family N-acetyltransferase [Dokdonella sp.]